MKNNMILCTDYAKRMGRSTRTIRRWIDQGKVQAIKRGRFWYVLENDERSSNGHQAVIEQSRADIEWSSADVGDHYLEQQQEEIYRLEQEQEREQQRERQEQEREWERERREQERQMWEKSIRQVRQVRTESIENLTESVENQRVENQQEQEEGIGARIVEAVKPAISKTGGVISKLIKSEMVRRKRDRENPAEAMRGMRGMVKSMVDLRNEVFNPTPVPPPVAVEDEDLDEDELDEGNDEGGGTGKAALVALVLGILFFGRKKSIDPNLEST